MDQWPDSPLIDQLLFDNWVPGLLVALVVGVSLVVVGLKRGRVKPLVWALVVMLVGGLFPICEIVVVTPRERFIDRTVRLADTVLDQADPAALAKWVTDDAVLTVGTSANPHLSGRPNIVKQAERALRRYEFRGHTYYIVDARQLSDTTAESYLKVGTRVHSKEWDMGVPKVTEWLFTWTGSADQWRVKEVRFLVLDNQEARAAQLP